MASCRITLLLQVQASFVATLATETLITSDEAVIAAAAAEAVALARAAVKAAKDVAQMVKSCNSVKTESKPVVLSTVGTSTWSLLTESEKADIIGDSNVDEASLREEYSMQNPEKESDILEPTNEELELLEQQLLEGIAVRSRRQTERKARRAKAAEKAATTVVSTKSGSSSKKKRGGLQEVDYSDPLRYLRGTTSTSKLLTANEELELSEGIQVRSK